MEQSLKDLVRELAEERGVDFRGYKPTTLERRIRRRMQQLGIDSYTEYGDYIRQRPAETTELLNTVLINVTRFFRDPQAWEVLREDVLPLLFRGRPKAAASVCGVQVAPRAKNPILSRYFWRNFSDPG